jgi:hypothetical protein
VTLRILVTGSRVWTDREAIRSALARAGREAGAHPQQVTVVHGGARGADQLAGEVAARFGCTVEIHPADWDAHGRAAGPLRNAAMVNLGADVCLAFIQDGSRGASHCAGLAEQAGIRVIRHATTAPNGRPD